jgi:hypothetical protein
MGNVVLTEELLCNVAHYWERLRGAVYYLEIKFMGNILFYLLTRTVYQSFAFRLKTTQT